MNPHANQYTWPYGPPVPPQYNGPYYQNPSGWNLSNHTQPMTPHLNPVLAAGMTSIRYDLRKPAHDDIPLYQQVALQLAFAKPTHDVRIISKAFPWVVNIHAPAGSTVTCGAIFEGLYAMLQKSIVDSEWGIVVHDKSKKETIEKAAKARHGKSKAKGKDLCLKRIDWLGKNTVFKGLERNKELEKKRMLPGAKACKETWVIKFGKP